MNPPSDLTPRGPGRAFWKKATTDYRFGVDEVEVLSECCRTLDTLDKLRRIVAEEGETARGSRGQPIIHPALSEARQHQVVLSRLIRQLGIPGPDEKPAEGEGVPSIKSARARRAARARWGDAS